jgi:hypothetical protein
MAERNTLLNAAIGALVSVVLSFTVFSPVLGGGVAGYLQRGDPDKGLRVGALSGVIASIPFLLLFVLFSGVVFTGSLFIDGGGLGIPGGFMFVFLFVFAIALAWTVTLSAVGGYLGGYVATETDIGG